ncbi:hypothetical protein CDQ84_16325 [Clostridium thermosuccinogenes]|jgi:hypothetical protein|uniref:Uncharacterized protein n=1 Tax=Clostridium thermosuccinogenes TaxID=84032 RepID=A0A2K2F2R0_9CLOT|nr:hypothetical protein CDO33_07410 [Pseudoclostridium thermosuccinogenes]PNT93052.1 hypothetical protein CDQ83_05780 [Pseudoclostridium thermosuccinogenes]PNT95097.1 hypothetical protein CDQ85_16090 [Pseudoclostridium thermosuccinogenes]PNT95844.1 hypothetical protein CDQ84_16325 [Pseudoclostridium thermosuccinogenes]
METIIKSLDAKYNIKDSCKSSKFHLTLESLDVIINKMNMVKMIEVRFSIVRPLKRKGFNDADGKGQTPKDDHPFCGPSWLYG